MAKNLNKSTRIHIYGGDKNEVMAFALIGFDNKGNNDSCVSLIRGNEKQIRRLLLYNGIFTENDINRILAMNYKEHWQSDDCSLIVRLA